ncbi:hypothetical protein C2I18_18375 [Paenibacillus sp. PK3_47]|nr:hypothetical protein C2I18_18375 [Paenibacillus sp. PK3_47]
MEKFHLPFSLLTCLSAYPLTAYCLMLSAYCLMLSAYCLLLTAYCLPAKPDLYTLRETVPLYKLCVVQSVD